MKKIVFVTIITSLGSVLFSTLVHAQPGSLDNTFDSDGKVTTLIGTVSSSGNSVAIQNDGKIIVAGESWNGTNYDFALARYNADGSLDNTFDADGKLTTDFGGTNDHGYCVAIQNDGKIIISGASGPTVDSIDFAIARYNTNGSLDNSFNLDGKLTTDLNGYNDFGESIAIQNDGKIVVAGYVNNDTIYYFATVRYHTDGSLDNSFDADGKIVTTIGSIDDVGHSVVIQADGKIIVGGSSNYDFALVRYNSDGSLDNSFDTDGKLTTDIGGSDDYGSSVVIQSDGKIILAGYGWNGPGFDFALARYHTDGSLDNSFDSDGKLLVDIGGNHDFAGSLALQSDGKIVVVGYSDNASNSDFSLTRHNMDGSLDNSFDSDGKVTTDFGGTYEYNYFNRSVVIQTDGRIVIAGLSLNSSSTFSVARYYVGYTGVNETVGEQLKIKIYPNPMISSTTIEFDMPDGSVVPSNGYELKIYDVQGKQVYQQGIYSKLQTIHPGLPAGTYFCKIYKGQEEIMGKGRKLVVQ